MAKQNVSFIERHVEKIVIGVAGSVLLFGLFVLIAGLHKVEGDSENLGPEQLYASIDQQAESARGRMRSASGDGEEQMDPEVAKLISGKVETPDLSLAVSPAPLNPPVAQVEGVTIGPRSKLDLVEILAPTKPVLTAGKAAARLPEPVVVSVGDADAGRRSPDDVLLPPTADWHWVSVFTTVNRRAQQNEFLKAGYSSDRQNLIVAELRVDRQERLASGQWSEPVRIQPYMPSMIMGKDTLQLIPEGTDYILPPEERTYLETYRSELEREEAQTEILRPVFQEYLSNNNDPRRDAQRYNWTAPAQLESSDGEVIDLAKTEITPKIEWPPEEDESETGIPGDRGGVAGGAAAARIWAMEKLAEATDLLDKKEFLEAREVLESLVGTSSIPDRQREQARQLIDEHLRDFQLAERQVELAKKGGGEDDTFKLGGPVEPAWINDTSVVPGKTYRYRVRIVALNQYAGWASRLSNSADARKLKVDGKWSEWSEPIMAEPARELFFSGKQRESGDPKVEIYEWSDGKWNSGSEYLTEGQMVAFSSRGDDFAYGAFVASVNEPKPFLRRYDSKDDSFKYREVDSEELVLVNAEGELEEHFLQEDLDRKKELRSRIREEEDLLDRWSGADKNQMDRGTERGGRGGVLPRLNAPRE